MNTVYYVVDTRTNEIVNAIEAPRPRREIEESMKGRFTDAEHLRLDPNPPLSMLERYRYWHERP